MVAARADFHERTIHCNAREPSGKLRFTLEIPKVFESPFETILHSIFGIFTIAGDPEGYPLEAAGMRPGEIAESGWTPFPSCCQKHTFFCAGINFSSCVVSCLRSRGVG